MKKRLLFLAFGIIVAGLDLPQPLAGRLSAQDPPLFDPFFTFFPSPNQPPDRSSFARMRLAPGTPTSTFVVEGGGRARFFDLRTGRMIRDIEPFGPDYHDPLAMTIFSMSGGVADTFLVGPALPSEHPMKVYQLTSPPTLLGETPDESIRAGGLRIAAGDVDADPISEIITGAGPGAFGLMHVIQLGINETLTANPYGPDFKGGIFVTTGDLNRDGKAEIVVTPESNGGELLVFDVAGGVLRLRGRGFPFGTDFRGGLRAAVGDVNADGFGDIITAPVSGPPRIRGFSLQQGGTPTPIVDFFAFDPSFTGGVFVSTGFINGHPLVMASTGTSVRTFRPDFDGQIPAIDIIPDEDLAAIAEFKRDLNLYMAAHTGVPPQ